MNNDREILLEVPKEHADAFLKDLRDNQISFDDPEEISALDGASVVQLILVVTPVISSAVAKIISTWRNKTEVVIKDGEHVYKGYTADDVAKIVGAKES